MAKRKTKTRRQAVRPRTGRSPGEQEGRARVPSWVYALGTVMLIAPIAAGAFLLGKDEAQSGGDGPVASTGLPNTPDYHSLLVVPTDANHILLGTHAGLYESRNGGRSWTRAALAGKDAMNLAGGERQIVWTAGHYVLAKSRDGGQSWADVRPEGLPSLDIHGFAVDPNDPQTLYAAVAGEGLFRSSDGAETFELVSREVGGQVFGLAALEDGSILAGDLARGLMRSEDGGESWELTEAFAAAGLAVKPDDPRTVLAAGQGGLTSGVLLSRDGGRTWREVLAVEEGAGPVAWSQSDPRLGYVVGFDRNLYKTVDGGASWEPVTL